MRIGVLASFRDPNEQGTWASIAGYRRVSQLVQLLSPLHEVHLYLLAKRPWRPTVPGCDSITVLAAPHLPGQWCKLMTCFLREPRQKDVWIAYNPSLAKLPVLIPRLLGIPVVIDYCDKQASIYDRVAGVRSRLYSCLQLAAERVLLRRIDAFLVISNRLKGEVLRRNPRARWLMYRGVFATGTVDDHGLELLPASQYVLYLGTLYDFNGPGVLVSALGQIAETVPELRLLLVGPGPEQERLRLQALAQQEGVADRVEFHSGLSDAQVFGLLQRVDMLALPYLDHPRNRFNFPTKLIEYLWAGKPVMASRIGEIPCVLEQGHAILLSPGDVDEWAEAMRALACSEELRICLGQRSMLLFRDKFSSESVRRSVDEFLTDLCAQSVRSES